MGGHFPVLIIPPGPDNGFNGEYEGFRQLLAFLTDDCCQGHPEICSGLMQAAATCGDAPARKDEP